MCKDGQIVDMDGEPLRFTLEVFEELSFTQP